ncbi:MAG: hypothetical protein QN152_08760 [Armatimonadota bacterium]|nr:hypothetical protein [Armatimonadota bacterium]
MDRLAREGMALAMGMAGMNGANWVYHMVMSRTLAPAGYGGLSALLGALFILTVPVTAIQMGVSASVARGGRSATTSSSHPGTISSSVAGAAPFSPDMLSGWLRAFLLLGLAASALVMAFSSPLAGLLRLGSPAPVMVLGTALVSWVPLPLVRGMLQGSRRFWTLGRSFLLEGMLRLGLGVLLVSLGLGLNGAVAAISLASLGALVVTLRSARVLSPSGSPSSAAVAPSAPAVQSGEALRWLVPYLLAAAGMTVLTYADVVFVKTRFPPADAGIYAAASTGGKIILYATAPLAMVMLPEVVRRNARDGRSRGVLLRTALYAVGAGGTLLAVYALAPGTVMRVLFGGAYVAGAPLLPLVGLGMLATELALLGIYYHLGAGRTGILRWIVLQAAAFPVALVALARSVQATAALVVVAGLMALGVVWSSLLLRSGPVRSPQAAGAVES